jgi:hypothetical protein
LKSNLMQVRLETCLWAIQPHLCLSVIQ